MRIFWAPMGWGEIPVVEFYGIHHPICPQKTAFQVASLTIDPKGMV
jgi:hypothetical protein